jgi:hypothetical protein
VIGKLPPWSSTTLLRPASSARRRSAGIRLLPTTDAILEVTESLLVGIERNP